MVREVDPHSLEIFIRDYRLTFLDCWAPWCKPCLELGKILEELDTNYKENPDIGFAKMNVQDYQEFALQNKIHGIPCVLVYFDGQPAQIVDPSGRRGDKTSDRIVGLRPGDHFEEVIVQLLG